MSRVPQARRRRTALVLATLLGASLAPLLAASPARAQGAPAALSPDQRAYWRDTAAELRARVTAAAVREEAATAAYSRMLTRRYPAGQAKAAIIDERDVAARALAEARAEVRDFKQQARAAGVPDRWIDPEGQAPPWWIDPDS